MRTVLLSCVVVFGIAGCFGNDISRLSKVECVKQGYHYKVEKRFNFREGEYQVESICYKKSI